MSDQGKTATWGQRLAAGLGAWRYGTVLGVFLLVVGALAWRLVDLHVVDNEFLRKQGDVRTILGLTDGLNRLFSTGFIPAKVIRRTGLAVVDNLLPVKSWLMRRGMGIEGNLPKLARGEALA